VDSGSKLCEELCLKKRIGNPEIGQILDGMRKSNHDTVGEISNLCYQLAYMQEMNGFDVSEIDMKWTCRTPYLIGSFLTQHRTWSCR